MELRKPCSSTESQDPEGSETAKVKDQFKLITMVWFLPSIVTQYRQCKGSNLKRYKIIQFTPVIADTRAGREKKKRI